mmetsp:Transcript_13133/g.46672  ORF Transcript_13133/g.46672 Transcript_13133/m.46672 type:complete len:258 (-) Transcript_13133:44-817(-)
MVLSELSGRVHDAHSQARAGPEHFFSLAKTSSEALARRSCDCAGRAPIFGLARGAGGRPQQRVRQLDVLVGDARLGRPRGLEVQSPAVGAQALVLPRRRRVLGAEGGADRGRAGGLPHLVRAPQELPVQRGRLARGSRCNAGAWGLRQRLEAAAPVVAPHLRDLARKHPCVDPGARGTVREEGRHALLLCQFGPRPALPQQQRRHEAVLTIVRRSRGRRRGAAAGLAVGFLPGLPQPLRSPPSWLAVPRHGADAQEA